MPISCGTARAGPMDAARNTGSPQNLKSNAKRRRVSESSAAPSADLRMFVVKRPRIGRRDSGTRTSDPMRRGLFLRRLADAFVSGTGPSKGEVDRNGGGIADPTSRARRVQCGRQDGARGE